MGVGIDAAGLTWHEFADTDERSYARIIFKDVVSLSDNGWVYTPLVPGARSVFRLRVTFHFNTINDMRTLLVIYDGERWCAPYYEPHDDGEYAVGGDLVQDEELTRGDKVAIDEMLTRVSPTS